MLHGLGCRILCTLGVVLNTVTRLKSNILDDLTISRLSYSKRRILHNVCIKWSERFGENHSKAGTELLQKYTSKKDKVKDIK